MSEEEINKMCSDIYEGEDWKPMKDYIKSLQNQLQQKANIIREVRKKLIKSKEYQAVKSLGFNSKMSVLIELEELLESQV